MSNSTGLVNHIALVSQSSKVTFDDVTAVSAAVAKQVARDFGPAWGISATVQPFSALEAVPSDYWPVILVDNDNAPGAAGFHTDQNGQPLALVQVEGNWPLTVSHEVLELLADPQGNRIVAAIAPPQAEVARDLISQAQGSSLKALFSGLSPRVDYLVEVCDPIESEGCAYEINGVPVSDFLFPTYYTSAANSNLNQVSFGGHTTALFVAPGGYVSFRDQKTGGWFQIFVDESGAVTGTSITDGSAAHVSLREWMDGAARQKREHRPQRTQMSRMHPILSDAHNNPGRAAGLRALIARLAGKV